MSAFKDWLTSLTSKSTPIDADELYVRDSSGTPSSKKLTWANLKATLASTFLPLTGGTVAGGTATASSPVVTVTQTFNNASVTFVGKSNEFTDTASNAASVLERWQLGGVSRLEVIKNGIKIGNLSGYDSGATITAAASYRALTFTALVSSSNFEFKNPIELSGGGTAQAVYFGNASSGSTPALVGVAGALEQRQSTNAQTSNRYRSYTDASNYSRVTEKWNTTTAIYHAEGLGTGSDGSVAFNDAELATNATVGFVMLPSCADAPSGTPADIPTGQVPVVFDSASSKIYAYIGGAWKSTPALT